MSNTSGRDGRGAAGAAVGGGVGGGGRRGEPVRAVSPGASGGRAAAAARAVAGAGRAVGARGGHGVGGPRADGDPLAGVVSAGRAGGGRGAARRRAGGAVLPDARAVGRAVHRGRDVRPAGAAAVRAEGAPPGPREGRPARAGALERGGLAAALAAVGLTAASRVGHADEQRIGLRGTTRRVWGRRG